MTLIKAQASSDHAYHFARLAQISSKDVFSDFFGKRANAVLKATFLQKANENSHEYTSFLQHNGEIAGMVHAYSAADFHAFERRSMLLYVRYSGWQFFRAVLHLFRLRKALKFYNSNMQDGDFYIGYLAIYPPYRGRRLSRTLIKHAGKRAEDEGCARLQTDLHERNKHAISVSLREGFEQIGKSASFTFNGENATVVCIAKPLKPTTAPTAPAM